MRTKSFNDELHSIRIDLDRIGLSALRLKRDLIVRKYRPDQPRAPAGTSEGGQWIGEGSTSRREERPRLAARKLSAWEKAESQRQYDRDTFHCTMVASESCHAQATVRWIACEKRHPIPPLNY